MNLWVNGKRQEFSDEKPATIASLIESLTLKGDRIAVEHNGAIVRRSSWTETPLAEGDKLEIVHFVGGGSTADCLPSWRETLVLRKPSSGKMC